MAGGGGGAGAGAARLRAALEAERGALQRLDRSIKKLSAAAGGGGGGGAGAPRYHNNNSGAGHAHDRFNNTTAEVGRGAGRVARNNSFHENTTQSPGKRRNEAKTVFSRLSARQNGDSEPEEHSMFVKKPRMSSQVTRDLPTKQEILKAQCGDEQSKKRNRRMFGSLLGTLQKFKQEEIVLKNKEDKKAQVERKIEEQEKQERENQRRERQTLFADRELKKATIKALEAKLARVAEFDKWESGQRSLGNFIMSRARPQLFWLPRRMDEKTAEKLAISRQHHERFMEKKRLELEEELVRIEHKCVRTAKVPQSVVRSTASKENKMAAEANDGGRESAGKTSPRKREKFFSEVHIKDESTVKNEYHGQRRESKDNNVNSKSNEQRKSSRERTVSREEKKEEDCRERREGRKEDEERRSKQEDISKEVEQNGRPAVSPVRGQNNEELQNESLMDTSAVANDPDGSTSPPPVEEPRRLSTHSSAGGGN